VAKVVLIGAGSIEFTRNVVADICTFPELADTRIALHDIDPERLLFAGSVARAVCDSYGAPIQIEGTDDRRDAFDGADYAVNEIQVGGFASTLIDFEIPNSYGLRQTIADTIGIGGIFRGLRTIPVVVDIANDMADVCPQAMLLNYTNPMAMVPWGVYAGSRFANVIGVCHSVRDTKAFLAETVGVPEGEIDYLVAGFNHQAFVIRFEHRGRDLYPLLDEAIERDPEGLGRRVRVEIYRQFGYFPTESSEHSAEYVPWFMRHPEQIERYRIPVDEYIRRSEENLAEYEELTARLRAGAPVEVDPAHEIATNIIHSIETGTTREEYVNVRNDGYISNLPDGCCAEVPAIVDETGVHPTTVGELPAQCAALNRTFLNVAELTVKAALEQRRDLVYQAALLDPNTAATLTVRQVRDMVDEMIEAHAAHLPAGIVRG
jgi:alpha-galactosidase